MARKSLPKNRPLPNPPPHGGGGKGGGRLVVVVEKGADRPRGGDGHKLGGRPHAADSRRDLGRDPFKTDPKRDRKE